MNDATPNNLGEAKSFDYIAEANVTASNNFHGNMVPLYWLQGALTNAINAIEQLDRIKKTLFYGRELTGLPQCHEVTTACQHLPALIDADNPARGELLLHSIVGTATEAGELLEMLSKVLFDNVPFDDVNFIEETGDGFWYAAIGLKAVNANFGDVQHRNIAKLRHRFPNKFTEYDANNRDLFGERNILEGNTADKPNSKAEVRIENWMQLGNVLVGDVVGHPRLGDAEGCRTSAIVRMDEANGICETRNTVYRLGAKAAIPASWMG